MIKAETVKYYYTIKREGQFYPLEENLTLFRLDTKKSTYVMAATAEGNLLHLYYGAKLGDDDLSYLAGFDHYPYSLKVNMREEQHFMDVKSFEYPCYGYGDFRTPCLKTEDESGHSQCELRYQSHEIISGKPELVQKNVSKLPALFGKDDEVETLVINMIDPRTGLKAGLYYSVFEEKDALARSVLFKNGSTKIYLTDALSACLDFSCGEFELVTNRGAWARERFIQRNPVAYGVQSISSRRGETSQQYNPFAALVRKETTEESGEAFGVNLIYSGNFIISAEKSQHDDVRLTVGINPYDFAWLLDSYDEFQTPEAVFVYSDEGLGGMSRRFHDLYRENLIRSEWKEKPRPVLINNWEATYFDFDSEKLLSIARKAKECGIEMLVMDDGWFGHRNNDESSLGDWFVNENKIKGGLKKLVDEVNALGLKFGLWIEPEMISPDSKLFEEHPDWAIQVPGRKPTLSRAQLVLDFSNQEVRSYIYDKISAVLRSANIEYIKWDMNRQLTDAGSNTLPRERQQELWHRYVLGVYDMMDRLTREFPHILLENCSGGGARFDAGMLYFSPQIWTSDNTDAIERLKIQYGTSLCYPPSSMGAHVSDCPNHATGRTTPFETRAAVAMAGTFGYELDVTRISEEDRKLIPDQIKRFKKYEPIVRYGDLYRLSTEGDTWMFVSKDKSEAVFTTVNTCASANSYAKTFRLAGLDENSIYELHGLDLKLSGRTLMKAGFKLENSINYESKTVYLTAVNKC